MTALLAEIEHRLAQKERVAVPEWTRWLIEDSPSLPDLVMGNRCALEPPQHWRRWMPEEDFPYQPSELARGYLGEITRRQLPKRRLEHFLWRQRRDLELLDRRPPQFWTGGVHEGHFSYIDLDAAYWQIYRAATLDLIYDVSTGHASAGRVEWLEVDQPWWAGNKQARNSVVGICRAHRSLRLLNGCVHQQQRRGFFLQPHLWAWIQDTLGAIAAEAVDHGALVVQTDGFILPSDRAREWQDHLSHRWNLTSRVQASGLGIVQGPVCWQVGDRSATGRPARNPIQPQFPPPPVREGLARNREWLLERRR